MKAFFHILFLFCLLAAGTVQAQSLTVFADSLRIPSGLLQDPAGNVWITETGFGFNDGRVSLVQPNGKQVPILVDLPCFFDTNTNDVIGPWRVIGLPANKLGLVTPLAGGVQVFDLSGFIPGVSAPLTAASATSVIPISDFVLQNQPPTKQESNPYSAALDATGNLYVVDAAFNGIVKVDAATGQRSVFATFQGFPNPLPFGPPVIDPVPTRILAKPGGGFFVCQLTGFPFLEGAASVFNVSATGQITPYATGLSLLTDMAWDNATQTLYVIQFGSFSLDPTAPGFTPGTAKVTRIKANGTQETVLEGFGPGNGIALTAAGDLLVTDFAAGNVWKLSNATGTGDLAKAKISTLALSPNPTADATQISFELREATETRLKVFDAAGKLVFSENLGRREAGQNTTDWDATGQPRGVYFVEIQTDMQRFRQKLVVR